MDSRKIVYRETGIIAIGQGVSLVLMFAVYAVIGKMNGSVVCGGLAGAGARRCRCQGRGLGSRFGLAAVVATASALPYRGRARSRKAGQRGQVGLVA